MLFKGQLCHVLGGLNNRNWFSHSSGDWKSKIRVSAGLVFSEALSLACRCLFCVPVSSIKVSSHIRLESTYKAAFYLHGLLKGPISKHSRILRSWGIRTSAWTWQDMTLPVADWQHLRVLGSCGYSGRQRKNLGIGVSSARVQVLASSLLCSWMAFGKWLDFLSLLEWLQRSSGAVQVKRMFSKHMVQHRSSVHVVAMGSLFKCFTVPSVNHGT